MRRSLDMHFKIVNNWLEILKLLLLSTIHQLSNQFKFLFYGSQISDGREPVKKGNYGERKKDEDSGDFPWLGPVLWVQ